MLDDWTIRLRALFKRTTVEHELDDELRFHVERQVESYVKAGLDHDEAVRRTRLEFGGLEQVKEECRDTRGIYVIDNLWQDVRYASRTLGKNPGFAAVAVFTLGLAMAACAVLFSAVNVLLRDLPFADPQHLAFVWSFDARRPATRMLVSYPDFVEWRTRTRAFDRLGAIRLTTRNFGGVGTPLRVAAAVVTPDALTVLGIAPTQGRSFLADDALPSAPPAVILTRGFWVRALGGDPTVIGRTVRLDSVAYTVVGILPASAEQAGVFQADVWTLLPSDPEAVRDRGDRAWLVVCRLQPDVSFQQAAAELESVTRALEREYPATNAGWRARLVPATELVRRDVRLIIVALGVVVTLVLLIACANVSGLLLARAAARRRETAVRLALGATRWRLVQQSLVESLALAVLASILGLLLAQAGLHLVQTVTRGMSPFFNLLAIDRTVLALAAALVAATPLIFGLAPALTSVHGHPAEDLKSAGMRGAIDTRARGRRSLVVSQFAMTMAILAVTSLFVRTMLALRSIELGFDPDRVLMMRIELPESRYGASEAIVRFSDNALEAVRDLAGVKAAAVTNRVPISDRETTVRFTIEGRSQPSAADRDWAARAIVSAQFLAVLKLPLLDGRELRDSDRSDKPRVALINRTMAQRYWPNASPVGAHLRFESAPANPAWIEIVGVVGDIRNSDADQPSVPQVYLPVAQQPDRALALLVRTNGDPLSLVDPIKRRIEVVDADQAVYDVRTMRQVVFDDLADGTILAGLFGAFGVIALTLALTGLGGMLAWLVCQRKAEIGLRMALGAQRGDILRQFLREGSTLVAIGIGVGLTAGVGLAQLIRNTLYGVSPLDPVTFLGVPAILVFAALLATSIPAQRAARVQPLEALRHE
jgi:putative ABC transport system permease protein